MKLATGKLFAFLDSDDLWRAGFVATLTRLILDYAIWAPRAERAPILLVCVDRNSRTLPALLHSKRFVVIRNDNGSITVADIDASASGAYDLAGLAKGGDGGHVSITSVGGGIVAGHIYAMGGSGAPGGLGGTVLLHAS